MVGSCHESRAGMRAELPGVRLNEIPAELPAGGLPSADTYLQAGTELTATLTTSNDNVRDTNLLRQRNSHLTAGEAGCRLLCCFRLRPLGDRTLQRRSPGGVERQRLVGLIAYRDAVGPAGGGVLGTQLPQALFLGGPGGLEGVGKLGVVHGGHPQAGLPPRHPPPRPGPVPSFLF